MNIEQEPTINSKFTKPTITMSAAQRITTKLLHQNSTL